MRRAVILCSLLAMTACAPMSSAPPPPPIPPPPAPGPMGPMVSATGPRVFTVYFAWNRSWVGPEGMGILKAAADTFRAGGVVRVQVTGYTDTSGSVPYNQRLSERRAWHVAQVLNRMGVPREAMSVMGRGEADLAVPTPNGVPDARNRRVTVVE